jgi:hypothetical protein
VAEELTAQTIAAALRAAAEVLDPGPSYHPVRAKFARERVCPSCGAGVGIWCTGVAEGAVHGARERGVSGEPPRG